MKTYDWRTPFEQNCRVPGSRCNWIMDMIGRGLTNKQIAERVRSIADKKNQSDPNRDCSAATINVYRKAFNGTLTEPAEFTSGHPALRENIDKVTR